MALGSGACPRASTAGAIVFLHTEHADPLVGLESEAGCSDGQQTTGQRRYSFLL